MIKSLIEVMRSDDSGIYIHNRYDNEDDYILFEDCLTVTLSNKYDFYLACSDGLITRISRDEAKKIFDNNQDIFSDEAKRKINRKKLNEIFPENREPITRKEPEENWKSKEICNCIA